MRRITHALSSFARFWWDFLIGDTPGIFLGVLAIIAGAFLLHRCQAAAIVLVPLAAVIVLLASTYRGARAPGA